MRMIVPNRPQQIATLFVEVDPHDCTGRCDAEACIVDQATTHGVHRQAGVLRQRYDPARVHLHDPQIRRTIRVRMDQPNLAALHLLD